MLIDQVGWEKTDLIRGLKHLAATLQSGIEGGVAISGGVGKSLKVNKRGGGGWNKLQGECLWMGCYKWMWREDQHMH